VPIDILLARIHNISYSITAVKFRSAGSHYFNTCVNILHDLQWVNWISFSCQNWFPLLAWSKETLFCCFERPYFFEFELLWDWFKGKVRFYISDYCLAKSKYSGCRATFMFVNPVLIQFLFATDENTCTYILWLSNGKENNKRC